MELINSNSLITEIADIIKEARKVGLKQVNTTLLHAYWNIGRIIVEHEQKGSDKAEYGLKQLQNISKELSKTIGKGFSVTNLKAMRRFYLDNQKSQAVPDQLTWTHYCELMSVSDINARKFYESECLNSNWSSRELRRQIDTSLFERLLLSDGDLNKKKVIELAKKGISYNTPEEIVKDPFVFEFLGIKENKPILERTLEKTLIKHIEEFLLELGRGFMFVGSQQRITLDSINYYVDMVFYNKILRAYVLIDLKIGKLRAENFGQMNMYLNYYKNEVNDEGDNDPVGIILCADKEKVVAEYSMQGLKNNIFASKYTYVIPEKEELIKQVELVLNKRK